MSLLRNVAVELRSLIRKKQVRKELDEELDSFLEMAVEEKIRGGMTGAEAFRAVRLERGSLEVAKEVVHTAGWESVLETTWQDVLFGFRLLLKNPGFTSTAVLTLAVAIGANTSVFSIVDAVLLRALPYKNADRLVAVWSSEIGQPGTKIFVSYS